MNAISKRGYSMRMQSTDIPLPAGSSLCEITHRVCNEYASVISSISRAVTRATNDEAKLVLAEAVDRLYEHASVHRALQMPMSETTEISGYLRNLCRPLCRSHLVDNGISLTLVEQPLVLTPEQCWHVGLIVFELVTNAVKHAFGGKGATFRSNTWPEPNACCAGAAIMGHYRAAQQPDMERRSSVRSRSVWAAQLCQGSVQAVLASSWSFRVEQPRGRHVG